MSSCSASSDAVSLRTSSRRDLAGPGLAFPLGREPRMLAMPLVVEAAVARAQLVANAGEQDVTQAGDAVDMLGVAVPDLHEDAVEADAEADAADVVAEGGAGAGDGGLQLLADGHEAHVLPEGGGVGLGNAEGPAAAARIARVLPQRPHAGVEERPHAGVEEVDAVAQRQLRQREVVEHRPEVPHVGDGRQVLEPLGVAGRRVRGLRRRPVLPVVVEVPPVDQSGRPVLLQPRLQEVTHLGAARRSYEDTVHIECDKELTQERPGKGEGKKERNRQMKTMGRSGVEAYSQTMQPDPSCRVRVCCGRCCSLRDLQASALRRSGTQAHRHTGTQAHRHTIAGLPLDPGSGPAMALPEMLQKSFAWR
nr:hypothetical protein CFP56_03097 [Quercus suber]